MQESAGLQKYIYVLELSTFTMLKISSQKRNFNRKKFHQKYTISSLLSNSDLILILGGFYHSQNRILNHLLPKDIVISNNPHPKNF